MTLPDPDGAGSLAAPVTSMTLDAVNNVLTLTDLVPILREGGGLFFDWTGTDTIHGGNGISSKRRHETGGAEAAVRF